MYVCMYAHMQENYVFPHDIIYIYICGKKHMYVICHTQMHTHMYVTGFAKTLHIHTRIEIHFIAYYNSRVHALSRHSNCISGANLTWLLSSIRSL